MYIYQLREIIFTSLKPRFPPRQGSMYTDTTTKNNEKCFQTIYNNLYQVLVLCSFIVDQNEHKWLMKTVGGKYFTLGPKSSTVVDLWRLVWQENVNQIIMLTNIIEDGKVRSVV